ncbi:MAG TPA: squalene synthase HpnC [Vicinamibacterales bacterium]|nr:squalene synthase HpnC [Vicinamibacterales bacterium]
MVAGARPQDQTARAYAHCEAIARAHYENFPVASLLLPAAMRRHIAAIYAFARAADDFADEPGLETAERLRRLDDWRARFDAAVARATPAASSDGRDLVFVALADTIRQHRLPPSLFEDLLSAFRQDVTTTRYATWTEVLDYCRRSANPVGRLVLRVAGYDDPRLDRASDAVCTALQLTNFWQDLARDWSIGRVYVPADDRNHAGARDEDLAAGRMTPEWRRVMAQMTGRTRALFAEGRAVCDGVRGRLRWELRLTWLGGSKILDKLEHAGFDVFRHRPTLGKQDLPGLVRDAVLWRRRG